MLVCYTHILHVHVPSKACACKNPSAYVMQHIYTCNGIHMEKHCHCGARQASLDSGYFELDSSVSLVILLPQSCLSLLAPCFIALGEAGVCGSEVTVFF